jgi:hypothetical protein
MQTVLILSSVYIQGCCFTSFASQPSLFQVILPVYKFSFRASARRFSLELLKIHVIESKVLIFILDVLQELELH